MSAVMKNLRFVVSNESAKAILNNDEYAELLDIIVKLL